MSLKDMWDIIKSFFSGGGVSQKENADGNQTVVGAGGIGNSINAIINHNTIISAPDIEDLEMTDEHKRILSELKNSPEYPFAIVCGDQSSIVVGSRSVNLPYANYNGPLMDLEEFGYLKYDEYNTYTLTSKGRKVK